MTVFVLVFAMLMGRWSEFHHVPYHAVGPEPVGNHPVAAQASIIHR